MDKLKFSIVGLCLLFWPLSLLIANTSGDFVRYVIPVVLLGLSIISLQAGCKLFVLPMLFVPFVEPKLVALPLIIIFSLFLLHRDKKYTILVLASLLILVFNWKGFWGQTIFQTDYEAQQEVIGKSYLYPSVFTARLFQNKPRIYINKFNNNFFALIDPGNYFFNFHPREILVDNQNLTKYPFLSLVFVLFGFYYLKKHPHWKFILAVLIGCVLSLSILKLFDRNDFILWVPLSFVLVHGIITFHKQQKKLRTIFYLLFFVFTTPELIRIFLR